MTEKQKKVLLLSLLSYTIGGFLFAVGLMLEIVVAVIFFYFLGVILCACGALSLYNNYKLDKNTKLYLFLCIIGVGLITLITVGLINQIL